MSSDTPTSETTSPGAFASKWPWQRARLRRQLAREAEWVAHSGKSGGVIAQLRARAWSAQLRSLIFLLLLFASVVVGVVYFVAIPIVRERANQVADRERIGQEQTLNAEEARIVGEFGRLKEIASGAALVRWRALNRSADLTEVTFVTPLDGWIVGNSGTIMKTIDGGETWTLQDSGTSQRLADVAFINQGTGWAVGARDTILRTNDGGETWTPEIVPDAFQRGVIPTPQLTIEFLQTGIGSGLNAVVAIEARSLWTVGNIGRVLRKTNASEAWVEQDSGTQNVLLEVDFIDSQIGWVVGLGGAILSTLDGGAEWFTQASGTEATLSGVTFADARVGWAVGNNGTILHSLDGGESWNPQNSPTDADLLDVFFLDASNGWTVGDGGTILETTDAGENWTLQESGTEQDLVDVLFLDSLVGWAVGRNGTILFTVDGGESWARHETHPLVQLRDPRTSPNWDGGPIEAAEDARALRVAVDLIDLDIGEDAQNDLISLLDAQVKLAQDQLNLPVASVTRADVAVDAAVALVEAAATEEGEDAAGKRAQAAAVFAAALEQKAMEDVWWRNFDEQIPAGVLLLFLLATLGSLYRYNSRIAGFYHARADALELMLLRINEDRLDKLATALAADQVEFRATKTPADMATEITKEMVAKLNLKPGA